LDFICAGQAAGIGITAVPPTTTHHAAYQLFRAPPLLRQRRRPEWEVAASVAPSSRWWRFGAVKIGRVAEPASQPAQPDHQSWTRPTLQTKRTHEHHYCRPPKSASHRSSKRFRHTQHSRIAS
jgi:hypothetical protein